uniref:Uncharacterized protein n=1 Tax=Anopheles quadriannulatus TaxID=34691 RepID=A0A182XRS0_ANOQN
MIQFRTDTDSNQGDRSEAKKKATRKGKCSPASIATVCFSCFAIGSIRAIPRSADLTLVQLTLGGALYSQCPAKEREETLIQACR